MNDPRRAYVLTALLFATLALAACDRSSNSTLTDARPTPSQTMPSSPSDGTVTPPSNDSAQSQIEKEALLQICDETKSKDAHGICVAVVRSDIELCNETRTKDANAICTGFVSGKISRCEEATTKSAYGLCRAVLKKDISICEETTTKDAYGTCLAILKKDISHCDLPTSKDYYALCRVLIRVR